MPRDNGPGGKGSINFDSYVTATPPPASTTTTSVKVIVPTDKKAGPPKPASLGGTAMHAFPDSYYE